MVENKWQNDVKDLTMAVSVRTGVDYDTTYKVVKGFIQECAERLGNGKNIKIRGLGNFFVEKKKQWRKYDFKLKKVVDIEPMPHVKFSASIVIRKMLHKLNKEGEVKE